MTPRELVLAQFPGKLYLGLVEAGQALGMAPKTAYNMNALGKFPLPITKLGKTGRMPMVAIHDIITYLEGGTSIKAAPPKPAPEVPVIEKRRGPGRPTKREARERAERLANLSS